MRSIVDLPALFTGLLIAAAITAALLLAHRGENTRRGWSAAAGLVCLLGVLAAVDLARDSPRETNFSTPVIAVAIATLAALGMVRATHRLRMWYRVPMVFATAFVLLLGGLLFAASYAATLLPF
jgi:hypothetical protein